MSAGDWKQLYAAAQSGDLLLVRYHISAGVNPNYQHPEVLCTPLVASLIQGHDDVALYLLEQGADPQLRSEFDDLTPLQAARQYGRVALLPRLLALGARETRQPFWRRWLPV
ncbi:ankyrin repeat domain-containing protein [Rhodoferax sp. BAB1]|uniref:ankyrin repeat domain-containing protein n=1 Tax=Rhodoferax sp. BAB1 TaxID=2741720 RepID=UPI001576F7D5|nr:ankyrin repeat domain-containing protein [Rhodoferax sp. BAB1]QKO20917.1 ankyrin repeat domain-containing protein [Rhodoferax sp. BAB1]